MFHSNETIQAATPANDSPRPRNPPETIPVFARRFGSWHLSVQRQPFSALELAQRYDRAAPGWARTLKRLRFPGAYELVLRRVFDEQTLKSVGARPRVLECGVGTGTLSCALADVLPVRCALEAIDISPRMLEHAHRGLHDADMDVTVREGDVRELPYADGVFDLAMTAHVVEHLGDPAVALREMTRVLKPGGLLIACTTRRSTLGRLVQLKWRTHRVTPAQAESWLIESGLGDIRCLSVGDGMIAQRLSIACVGAKISQPPTRRAHPK